MNSRGLWECYGRTNFDFQALLCNCLLHLSTWRTNWHNETQIEILMCSWKHSLFPLQLWATTSFKKLRPKPCSHHWLFFFSQLTTSMSKSSLGSTFKVDSEYDHFHHLVCYNLSLSQHIFCRSLTGFTASTPALQQSIISITARVIF